MRIAKSHEKYVCSRIFVLQVKDQIRDILVLSLAPNVHPFQTRNISWRGVVNIFIIIPSLVGLIGLVICMNLHHFASASKSKTISFVSSVPFRDPTAHTWGAEQSCNWKLTKKWRKNKSKRKTKYQEVAASNEKVNAAVCDWNTGTCLI